jgi:uncharacterized cupin superfamily protein
MADDWFVRNARDESWLDTAELGKYCNWEREGEDFEQLGINLNVMRPGEAMTMYHREPTRQEDFLVLDGEALLIVEGEERPLKKWDLFHCPPGVAHAIVGAGDRSCLVLAVGSRMGEAGVEYVADPVAQKHETAVAGATTSPREAYAAFELPPPTAYQEGWLPD